MTSISRLASTASFQVYRHQDLPAIFRLSPLASPALDASLEARGWRRFDESIVMTLDLADGTRITHKALDADIEITSGPDDAWLEGCRLMNGVPEADAATFGVMLDSLLPAAGFGRLIRDDGIAALALSVVDIELAGLFVVTTAKQRRRQGLASRLLSGLLDWSRALGATTGWLAVEACNAPAVRLYESLGFREVYRYHYRSNDQILG